MFSSRTAWDRAVNPLARAASAARGASRALLDLTETNPTAAGLLAPPDLLALLGDPARGGVRAGRRGLGDRPARRWPRLTRGAGAAVAPGHVVLTAEHERGLRARSSSSCAIPATRCSVPRPSYPLFQFLADLESVEVVALSARATTATWHLRASRPRRGASPPRTRAVVVVAPNNPTGSYLKKDEWDALSRYCAASAAWP